jgi:ribonuclease J
MWTEPEPTRASGNIAETRTGVLHADLGCQEFATAGVLDRRGTVAWSSWEGYLKMPSVVALQELFGERQISLTSVHASGDASVFDLRRLGEALGPKRVVPIHSDAGDRICEFFSRAERHADGDWWQVRSR